MKSMPISSWLRQVPGSPVWLGVALIRVWAWPCLDRERSSFCLVVHAGHLKQATTLWLWKRHLSPREAGTEDVWYQLCQKHRRHWTNLLVSQSFYLLSKLNAITCPTWGLPTSYSFCLESSGSSLSFLVIPGLASMSSLQRGHNLKSWLSHYCIAMF